MILILFFIFLFGLAIGSFLNCLIWRLHTGEGIWGRSYCPKCKHQIEWYDNIPVLSFIILRGKCRHCQKTISWQYPLVELMTGILFVLAVLIRVEGRGSSFELIGFFDPRPSTFDFFIFPKLTLLLFRDFFIISIMTIVFIYDLRWYMILDVVTVPACVFVFILNLLLGISWQNMLFSGIIGSSFFLIQFIISQGKWIGGGDIRLGVLMGFALGWPNIIVAILFAYIIGSVVGIALILTGRKKWNSQVPLGVFLSTSTVIVLFLGKKIISWYLNFFSL